MSQDIAAITCFFSYAKNPHSVQRYKEFKARLKRQGVDLYTIELAFFDEDYLMILTKNEEGEMIIKKIM